MMQSNKRNWKIYYSDYSGVVRRAVEFVSAQMGELILRDAGIYSIHVTAVEKLNEISHENAVILGTYDSHPFFEQFISKDEIKKDGFTVKVIDNPSKKEHQLVLLDREGDLYPVLFEGEECLSLFGAGKRGRHIKSARQSAKTRKKCFFIRLIKPFRSGFLGFTLYYTGFF